MQHSRPCRFLIGHNSEYIGASDPLVVPCLRGFNIKIKKLAVKYLCIDSKVAADNKVAIITSGADGIGFGSAKAITGIRCIQW